MFDYDASFPGYNLFVYCGNEPILRIDCSGADSAKIDDLDIADDQMENVDGGQGFFGGSYGTSWGSSYGSTSSYAYAYNPIDAGYSYHRDLSMASNSSSFTGGILTNGYTAYCTYANSSNQSINSAQHSSNPLTHITYTEKVINQQAAGNFHGFPFIVDNYGNCGKMMVITGGDGRQYNKLIIPGAYLGHNGYFEYIWDQDGICNHRVFKTQ